ncbi:hypothetical protein N7454_000674 [Penicillium verhagenii]|nr:hypothetical protein N7454_000674 [Penicillium verhagenii]
MCEDPTEEEAAPSNSAADIGGTSKPRTRTQKKRPRGDDQDAMDEDNCENPVDDTMDEDISDDALIKLLEATDSPTDEIISQETPKSSRERRRRSPGF